MCLLYRLPSSALVCPHHSPSLHFLPSVVFQTHFCLIHRHLIHILCHFSIQASLPSKLLNIYRFKLCLCKYRANRRAHCVNLIRLSRAKNNTRNI